MSREAYTPPSLSQPGAPSGASTNNPAATHQQPGSFNITGAGNFEDASRPVHYLCGDCDAEVILRKSDPIRCKECGYRVLYKGRTNR